MAPRQPHTFLASILKRKRDEVHVAATDPATCLILDRMQMASCIKELGNYREQKVYRLAYLPKGRKAVGSRAVCELKWDKMTGMLDKAKVRIVGQGFS